MSNPGNDALLQASDAALDALLFNRSIGNLKDPVTPDKYLQHFRDASEETKDYKTEAETRLDLQTEMVISASDEIDQILEKTEAHLGVASDNARLINDVQKTLQASGQSDAADAIKIAMASLTAQLLASQAEVLKAKARVHELETEVSTDHLTQAKNRVALDKKLEALEETKTPFSVIQCDLDFFKVINDTFGHAAGDEVLQVFTKRMQQHLKSSDQLYRAGGDEFVVILDGAADPAHVKKVIGRLKAAVCSEPIVLEGKEVPISTSMGGGICNWDSSVAKAEAFHSADKMLYKDKESETRAQTRLEMEKVSIAHAGKAKGFRA